MIHAFQHGTQIACIAALAVIALAIIAAKIAAPAWDALRRFASLGQIKRVVIGVFLVVAVMYGGAKPKWRITFDGGIKNSIAQPSNITNNLVNIRWERDTSAEVFVPESAVVYIDYQLWSQTNQWQTLGQTTVGAWHYSTMLNDATNYLYNVWAYYIPPEPVHTNGVWVYKTLKDRAGKYAIPLRARIEVNGKAIATPCEKRKDEEND